MDIWRDVYTKFTTINFEVIAADNGIPKRGTTVSVNITLSNTCTIDVEYGVININLTASNDGTVMLKIPKYYMLSYGK